MMKRLFTILLLFSVIFLSAQEKQSYKIDLKIKGLEDSVLYLAYYYGDKTFLIDTALKKGKNNYLFIPFQDLTSSKESYGGAR